MRVIVVKYIHRMTDYTSKMFHTGGKKLFLWVWLFKTNDIVS